jgi:DNA polymerase-3 subunit epsilon/oligoribonuclease
MKHQAPPTPPPQGKLGIFLDTETSGLCPRRHRTLEIALKIVDLSTGEVCDKFHSIVRQPKEVWERSDPHALQVNGFTYRMLEQGRSEGEVASCISELFTRHDVSKRNAFFICQNPSLDRTFFGQLVDEEEQKARQWPYHWLDFVSMNWALSVFRGAEWPKNTPLSKDCIADRLGLAPEAAPHRAMNGVDHLLVLYKRVVGFPAVIAAQSA